MTRWKNLVSGFCAASAISLFPAPSAADEIRFVDVARQPWRGIHYHRVRSATNALFDAIKAQPVVLQEEFPLKPLKARGAPGVALLDYDGDGDLDLYVTNGPGAPNSLYKSFLAETGHLAFLDVAVAAGVAATSQDSTGVCFGDLDNDGDEDLFVLGRAEPHRLFENRGNGTFADRTAHARVAGTGLTPSGCTMADFDGDGRLDLFVANTADWSTQLAILVEPFALNQPNELYRNLGGLRFADVSASSGLQNVADISWATTAFDYDDDCDVDLFVANDQGGIPTANLGGIDRGFTRLYQNDGTGQFTDVTFDANLTSPGGYMGIAVADFNGDQILDVFVTNTGDWLNPFFGIPYVLGDQSTRWFLGGADGRFSDPLAVAPGATPFGWGNAAFDYDNDGDTDLAYIGGLDAGPFVEKSNPGVLFRNDGAANFVDQPTAFDSSLHLRRKDHGLAVGDLDQDGFVDVVTVSSFNIPSSTPMLPIPISWGSPFDGIAGFAPTFSRVAPGQFVWNGVALDDGTLTIELNSGGNGKGSVAVRTVGTVGLTSRGAVNRDGIGAVARFTPRGGTTAVQPVLGGASTASQSDKTLHFGLGTASRGDFEIRWPSCVKNKVYDVRNGERLVMPEIPCSYDGAWPSFQDYKRCVREALDDFVAARVIRSKDRSRLENSAIRAYREAH
jgi:enediyne biosynthesis protein E4